MVLDYAHAGLQAFWRSNSEVKRLNEELETARQVSLQKSLIYPPELAALHVLYIKDYRCDVDLDDRNYKSCVLKALRNFRPPKEELAMPKVERKLGSG